MPEPGGLRARTGLHALATLVLHNPDVQALRGNFLRLHRLLERLAHVLRAQLRVLQEGDARSAPRHGSCHPREALTPTGEFQIEGTMATGSAKAGFDIIYIIFLKITIRETAADGTLGVGGARGKRMREAARAAPWAASFNHP